MTNKEAIDRCSLCFIKNLRIMFDNEGHWIDDPLDVVNAKPDFSGLGIEPQAQYIVVKNS